MQSNYFTKLTSIMGAMLCCVVLLASTQMASAETISGSFYRYNNAIVESTEVTGLPAVAQPNWNNFNSPGNANPVSYSGLIDSDGNPSPATVAITKKGAYYAGPAGTDGNTDMFRNHFGNTGTRDGSIAFTFTLSNVPYTQYSLYVYVGGNSKAPGTGFLQLNGGAKTYWNSIVNPWDFTTWAQVTDTTGVGTPGNYILYTGLSGTTLLEGGSPDSPVGICGFQVVNTGTVIPPPPMTPIVGFYPADAATDVSPQGSNVYFSHDGAEAWGYRLFLKEGAAPTTGDKVAEIQDASIRSFGITNFVAASKTYQWYVEAYNGSETVKSATMTFTTGGAGGGVSGSIPTAGMLLHLDATDVTTTTQPADGTLMDFWKDKSGNGNHVTQTDPLLQPTFQAANAQGYPVMNVEGRKYLTRPDSMGLVGNPAMTCLVVLNTPLSGEHSFFNVGSTAGSDLVTYRLATDSSWRYNGGNSVYTGSTLFGQTLMLGEFAKGQDVTYAEATVARNGVPGVQSSFGSGTKLNDIPAAGTITHVGAGLATSGGIQNSLDGFMAELVIYDRVLTSAERTLANEYFSTKWGLTAPSVNITAPTGKLIGGEIATVSATASDSFGGTVKQVEFFADGVSIGVVTELDENSEYSLEWIAAGSLVNISAIVTDNDTPVALTAGDSILIDVVSPVFVAVTAAGTADGSSFANAQTLDTAIAAANAAGGAISPIFLKAGVYNLTAEIPLNVDASLYGGFAGTESSRFDRTGTPGVDNVTELNGGGVTRILNLSSTLDIDRITFKNGSADNGGAIYANANGAIITDCVFEGNTATAVDAPAGDPTEGRFGGGAVYVIGNPGPVFLRCTFRNNTAAGHGGGILYDNTSPEPVTDCLFEGNSAPNGVGGAMAQNRNGTQDALSCVFKNNSAASGGAVGSTDANNHYYTRFYNCEFVGNTSTIEGGAMYLPRTYQLRIAHCTFHGNSTTAGTADGAWISIRNDDNKTLQTKLIVNNLFSGHVKQALVYSHLDTTPMPSEINSNLFVGGVIGGANGYTVTQDPSNTDVPENMLLTAGNNFVNAATGDFDLVTGAPAINQGVTSSDVIAWFDIYNNAGQAGLKEDIKGRSRFDQMPDLGANELAQGGISLSPLSLNFGFGLPVGVATTQTLTITSIGNTSIDVQSATITGNPSSAVVFETIGDTDPFNPIQTLASGETLDVVVQMTPAAIGNNYEGQIHVLAVGGASALSVDLIGGTDAPPAAVRSSWLLYETK